MLARVWPKNGRSGRDSAERLQPMARMAVTPWSPGTPFSRRERLTRYCSGKAPVDKGGHGRLCRNPKIGQENAEYVVIPAQAGIQNLGFTGFPPARERRILTCSTYP